MPRGVGTAAPARASCRLRARSTRKAKLLAAVCSIQPSRRKAFSWCSPDRLDPPARDARATLRRLLESRSGCV